MFIYIVKEQKFLKNPQWECVTPLNVPKLDVKVTAKTNKF